MSVDAARLHALREEANQALLDHRYDQVVRILEPVVDEIPSHAESLPAKIQLLLWLGIASYELRRMDHAERYLRDGLALAQGVEGSNRAAFYHELALVAFAANRLQDSANLARSAIRLALEESQISTWEGLIPQTSLDVRALAGPVIHLAMLLQPQDAVALLEALAALLDRSYQITLAAIVFNELGLAHLRSGNLLVGLGYLGRSIQWKARESNRDGIDSALATIDSLVGVQPELLTNDAVRMTLGPLSGLVRTGVGGYSLDELDWPWHLDAWPQAKSLHAEGSTLRQMRSLSEGLFAGMVVRGGLVTRGLAREHYLTFVADDPLRSLIGRVAGPPAGFVRRVSRAVAGGVLKPIVPLDLLSARIETGGRSVPLWNDIEINRDLQAAGSRMRLVVLGARSMALTYLLVRLEGEAASTGLDPRFLVGIVGPVTASPAGHFYDFRRELAVSVWGDPMANHFTYEDKVVLRVGLPLPRGAFGVGHELVHALAYHDPSWGSYHSLHWREAVVADILCFVQVPRRRTEIRSALGLAGTRMFVSLRPDTDRGPEAIDHVVDSMIERRTLEELGDGRVRRATVHS